MALTECKPLSKEAQIGPGRPKKTSRKKATKAEWRELHAAKQGPCRVCGKPPTNNLHHLVAKSAGGADTFDNLAPLCGMGNADGCHGLVERNDSAALAKLAANLEDGEYAYIHEKLGEGALERLFGVTYTPPMSDLGAK